MIEPVKSVVKMYENLIDKYLLNLLNPEERELFESQLKKDQSLQNELIIQRETLNSIEEIGRIELKSELKVLHESLDLDTKKPKSKIISLVYRLAAASMIIGLLSIGWWWTQQAPSNNELFSQNFEAYEISMVQRSLENTSFKSIENLYNNGQYEKAIPLFLDQLNDEGSNSSVILLGLGISYLKTDQLDKAITQFDEILANNDFNFKDEAQWYLSLSYLKLGDINSTKSNLKPLITDSTRDHHTEASKLFQKLKK